MSERQSNEEIAEMIARFRTPPGCSWEPLRNDIVTLLESRDREAASALAPAGREIEEARSAVIERAKSMFVGIAGLRSGPELWSGSRVRTFVQDVQDLRVAVSRLAKLEPCEAAPTPTPSEQRASAKPQDEAEMRARAAEIATANPLVCALCLAALPNPDCGHRANGQTPCCVPATDNLADDIFEALKQERARARREAMEGARTAVRLSACKHEGSSVVDAIARHQLKASVEAIEALMTAPHPEAKAEDAPPDPLDRPVTYRALIEALRDPRQIRDAYCAGLLDLADTLERSASLHTEER